MNMRAIINFVIALVTIAVAVTAGHAQEGTLRSTDLQASLAAAVSQISNARNESTALTDRAGKLVSEIRAKNAIAGNLAAPPVDRFRAHSESLRLRATLTRDLMQSQIRIGEQLQSADNELGKVAAAMGESGAAGGAGSADDAKHAIETAHQTDAGIGDLLGRMGDVKIPAELAERLEESRRFFKEVVQNTQHGDNPVATIRALRNSINRWKSVCAKAVAVSQRDIAMIQLSAISGLTQLAAQNVRGLNLKISFGNAGGAGRIPPVPHLDGSGTAVQTEPAARSASSLFQGQ